MAQALWMIKQFELVISMKFHGIMFAVNQGVPFINSPRRARPSASAQKMTSLQLSIPRYSLEKERFLEVVKIAEAAETRQAVASTSAHLRDLTRKRLPEIITRFLAA